MRTRLLIPILAAVAASLVLAGPAPAASQRIVTLSPFTANALAALRVKPKAIGVMPGTSDFYSTYLNGIRRLPLSHPSGPNMEQLAVLNPSLVLSSPEWRKGETTMRQLGIKVVDSDPQTVAAVPAQMRRIGALVGKAAAANRLAAQTTERVRTARGRAKTHPRVLLILGVGRTPYAFLRNSWGGDVVTQAGGTLITKGLTGSGGFARISNEYVVQQKPDVIIAVPHSATTAADRRSIAAFLKSNPAWQDTPAARNGRLYVTTDNQLLQAWPSAAQTIANVQTKYLKNR